MSKSVDETVVDFFRLLLSEETEPVGQNPAASKLKAGTVTDGHDASSLVTASNLEDAAPAALKAEKTEPAHNPAVSGAPETAKRLVHTSTPVARAEPELKAATEIKASPLLATPKMAPKATVTDATAGTVDKAVLDKAALEKLLAPVFDTKTATQTTAPKADTAANAVVATKAKVEISTPVEVQPKVEVPPETTPEQKLAAAPVPETEVSLPVSDTDIGAPVLQTQTGAAPPSITKDLQAELDDEFQVLFFKVAGLTLAVPLVSLGGIVKVDRINQIFGRPNWFLGVQTHRDSQLNLVDTCAWVMPEKYDEELAQSVNYQYLVLLEDSNWGLACETLVNSVRIKQSEVNWRTTAGKRPWLAGVVKEQMCGILNVQALIQMLNAGLGCQDPIN
ncbi:chemotaxis protein CheW [Shewanella sp. 3B26]|uniref:Chemotaxis protein CheW n=1 Tax=Shewanella zhuhaiensis TaxID=2919576 RepID=A0AAJ1BHF5_9GAMM|nr:chemotaxis protein CheW [Shewanella zhuhaiensis]MCH4293864.1 chemotaxis protein CheW [Shewanella zhuhaiensis]